VTWRLAARFADELNLDALAPADVEQALPVIASRCEEIGRDPSTLRVSIHIWGAADAPPGKARQQRLRDYASLGLSRAMVQGFAGAGGLSNLEPLAEDCAAVGLVSLSV
jgi:alkanesulfonate monooxygenase SsuD/methylene tetrahydromethanopterin reductase-like flavin-dependent oxidoreductase (luciferase family)